jgi:phage N-6-adenine-methyltransferase
VSKKRAMMAGEITIPLAQAVKDVQVDFPNETKASLYHGWLEQGENHPWWGCAEKRVGEYHPDDIKDALEFLCSINPLDPITEELDHIDAVQTAEVEAMLAESPESDLNEGDEWYTPSWLIEKAKWVMGGIDIDPASCAEAQKTVQAAKYFDKSYMGGALGINWVYHNGPNWAPARVWLNPPYSHPLIEQFIERLLQQIEAGYVGEAILLVNNNTETAWWHKAASAAAVTFTFRSRVFFWRPGREDATSPRQGQTAFYFGPNALKFIEVFKDKGISFMRWETGDEEE